MYLDEAEKAALATNVRAALLARGARGSPPTCTSAIRCSPSVTSTLPSFCRSIASRKRSLPTSLPRPLSSRSKDSASCAVCGRRPIHGPFARRGCLKPYPRLGTHQVAAGFRRQEGENCGGIGAFSRATHFPAIAARGRSSGIQRSSRRMADSARGARGSAKNMTVAAWGAHPSARAVRSLGKEKHDFSEGTGGFAKGVHGCAR